VIEVTTTARAALGRSFRYYVRAQSWRDGELLHDDVPITSGTEEGDRDLAVPTRVTLTVPQRRRGYDWTPTTDEHPLAANGQELHVQLGIDVGTDGTEWFERGVFLITESEPDGQGGISVQASDLLYRVSEARYASPYQPSGTLKSTLRGLVEPALTVLYDTALTDRSVPTDVNYDGTRLDAVRELVDSWPADYTVTSDGYLYIFSPVTPTTQDIELTDGVGGTVIRAMGSSTREDAFNVVVARGRTADGADVQGASYVEYGPRAYAGAFNPLAVTYEYFSPMLTTEAQCRAAAQTVRDRKLRQSGREYRVEMVPDPTLQLGDAVLLNDVLCTVQKLSLPYKPATMTLTARSVS